MIGDAAYAVVKPHIDAVLRGKPQDFESRLVYRRGGRRHVRIQYIPHLGASGDVRGFFTLVADISEQKRAEEARRLLADATALLDPVLDRDTSYRRVAELAVASMAAFCSVHSLDPDGTLRARVIAHADPAKAALVSRLAQRGRRMAGLQHITAALADALTCDAVSPGPGEGSTLSVWLPLAGAPAESAAAPATEIPRSGAGVLLVDDNVDAAEGLRRILQLHGHTVSMVHDGPAALESARASKPELVLLDLGLPGMDGYEVVRRLRAEPELRRSYIAAVSGYGQDQDRRRSREAGFDAHLTKPVATAQLLALVAEAAPRG